VFSRCYQLSSHSSLEPTNQRPSLQSTSLPLRTDTPPPPLAPSPPPPPPAAVGAPVVDNCLSGFNSSIFAYGQTGAGKTYTMTGRIGTAANPGDAAAREQRGLAPRVFEYLFERIEAMQDQQVRLDGVEGAVGDWLRCGTELSGTFPTSCCHLCASADSATGKDQHCPSAPDTHPCSCAPSSTRDHVPTPPPPPGPRPPQVLLPLLDAGDLQRGHHRPAEPLGHKPAGPACAWGWDGMRLEVGASSLITTLDTPAVDAQAARTPTLIPLKLWPRTQIREDIKRGCYVEGLSEEIVQNGECAPPALHSQNSTGCSGSSRSSRSSSSS